MNLTNSFQPVKLSQKDCYYQYWQKTPKRSLDYTLANIWGWQNYFGLEWLNLSDLLLLRQRKPEPLNWAPLGDWTKADWDEMLANLPEGQKTFIRVPEELVQIWQQAFGSRLTVIEDRGHWEYIYNQSDLANLPGKNYHKKKNHYSGYVKEYGEPNYIEVNNMIVEDVLALQDEWCQWHECEDSSSLRAENEAINQVLSHWNMFQGLSGGALYINERIVAFSIGEQLDQETIGVHFEKGLNGYKGIYQTINKVFSTCTAANFKFINRAQDLDEEGLRQAKMSYHPTSFLKKYRCIID
ncbi:MAG: DUF2156 domain-containing protein [Desulfovibrionaceae bacterium]|nr:DUF2156 domain-containing protein [Desulfovibrionaceae bacterium]